MRFTLLALGAAAAVAVPLDAAGGKVDSSRMPSTVPNNPTLQSY